MRVCPQEDPRHVVSAILSQCSQVPTHFLCVCQYTLVAAHVLGGHSLPRQPGQRPHPGLISLSALRVCALCCPGSMKGKNSRLHNATRTELWQRLQRPLNDLQLWKALAQRLLDITTSLPDLPSIHTFLPQIEVSRFCGAGEVLAQGVASQRLFQGQVHTWLPEIPGSSSVSAKYRVYRKGHHLFSGTKVVLSSPIEPKPGVTFTNLLEATWNFVSLEDPP